MRDLVERLVHQVVNQVRPPPRYGTVTAVDIAVHRCSVLLAGEEESSTVVCGSFLPTVGDVVRVEHVGADRWVADVLGRSTRQLPRGAGIMAELNSAGFHANSPPSAYPQGMTYLYVGAENQPGGSRNWPAYGMVVTHKVTDFRVWQEWISRNGRNRKWRNDESNTTDRWTEWRELTGHSRIYRYRVGNVNIPSSPLGTVVLFGTEAAPARGALSYDPATGRVTVDEGGTFILSGGLRFDSGLGGEYRVINIMVNGENVARNSVPPSTSPMTVNACMAGIDLVPGDRVSIEAQHDRGSNLAIVPQTKETFISVMRTS